MTPGVRDEGPGEEEEMQREQGKGGERGRGVGDGNAWPEERTSERGRELVRAGAFPLANSRARDGQEEGERDWNKGERERGRKKMRERETEEEVETREKTLGRERDGT